MRHRVSFEIDLEYSDGLIELARGWVDRTGINPDVAICDANTALIALLNMNCPLQMLYEYGVIVQLSADTVDEQVYIEDLTTWATQPLISSRAFDVFAASILTLVLLPLLCVIPLVIKLLDGGPVLHRVPCTGLNGRVFNCFNFRNPRIMRGFMRGMNIDELPQLLNILRGDMTFVGWVGLWPAP
jgi:hypothetical protein